MKRIIPRFNALVFEVEFITEEKPQPAVKSDSARFNRPWFRQ